MIELATMSSVCPDWNLDEVIAGMKRHGYRGLEPRVEWGHACGIEADLTAEERREIGARMAERLGVHVGDTLTVSAWRRRIHRSGPNTWRI